MADSAGRARVIALRDGPAIPAHRGTCREVCDDGRCADVAGTDRWRRVARLYLPSKVSRQSLRIFRINEFVIA